MEDYNFVDHTGKVVGEITIFPDPMKKQLYIASVSSHDLQPNTMGPSLIRDIKRQLKELYPDYETITGYRISGAREEAGAPKDQRKPVVKLAVGDGKEVLYHGTSKDKPFDKFREAPNGTWFTTNPKEASQYAVENDSMGHRYEGGKFVATNTASRVIAMTHDFKNTLEITEWPDRLMKDNYKKAQSEWFTELRKEGYDSVRLKLDDGHSIVVSLDNSVNLS